MNIRYFVSDLEKSIAFYRDVLGFELIVQWGPAFAIMTLDKSNQLWLSGPQTSAATAAEQIGEKATPGGWNRIVVPINQLENELPKLVEKGAKIRIGLVTGPGGKQVLIDDPDGNPIELFDSNLKL
ncbi:MAG: VOC family protein [Armatimonadetes bacterium]|nr:VOC family protein [Armatimonadota bacterium]MBS1728401.1 VOC family protein [Armatimonadota bacterium]